MKVWKTRHFGALLERLQLVCFLTTSVGSKMFLQIYNVDIVTLQKCVHTDKSEYGKCVRVT